jgi:hypothetical protein
MSIGLIIKSPEGLVLAAESRITLSLQIASPSGDTTRIVSYDNVHKVLNFGQLPAPHSFVGVVTYGLGGIGIRSAYSFLPEFQASLPRDRLSVQNFSQTLSDFFMQQWANANIPPDYHGPPMTFVVGGFNDGEPYGRTYIVEIPRAPAPVEQQPNAFGITWGGQREIVDRLVRGYDGQAITLAQNALGLNAQQIQQLTDAWNQLQMQIPIDFMPLQDCVDLAVLFIRTTIEAQRLTAGIRGCGGPIDIATITRNEGLRFIQQKGIKGEDHVSSSG